MCLIRNSYYCVYHASLAKSEFHPGSWRQCWISLIPTRIHYEHIVHTDRLNKIILS